MFTIPGLAIAALAIAGHRLVCANEVCDPDWDRAKERKEKIQKAGHSKE